MQRDPRRPNQCQSRVQCDGKCRNDSDPVGEGDSVMHTGGRKAMEEPPTGGKGAPVGLVKAGAQES